MTILFSFVWNLTRAIFSTLRNVLKLLLWIRPAADFVVFELSGDPPYRPLPWRRRLADRLAGRPVVLDLYTLDRRLRRVERNGSVRGVVLQVENFSTSLSKLDMLRSLVQRVRQAGKQVIFWTAQASTRDALLLLCGDRLFLAPAGRLDLRGFALETTTARQALQHVGARATVFRRGRYKSAAELVTRDGISPENQEMLEAILDDWFDRLVQAVAAGRGLDQAAARQRIDEGPYMARRAEQAGLVDGLCYADELPERLGSGSQPEQKARLVRWPRFQASLLEPLPRHLLRRRPLIAVVSVRGFIGEGHSRQMLGGGRVAGAHTLSQALEMAQQEPSVRAVLLHVDSRGGSALASDLIWRAVRQVAQDKPVVAFLDAVAASGGYYVAAGAKHIVASPGTLTGSIGVLSGLLDFSDLYRRVGVTRQVLARGLRSALGTTSRPPTEDEAQALERDVEEVYQLFLERVAEGRSMEQDKVAERAEGRVFTGSRAVELGLADELGSFDEAVQRARELAGVPREAPLDLAFSGEAREPVFQRLPAAGEMLDRLVGDEFQRVWLHAALNEPTGVWAVCPWRME